MTIAETPSPNRPGSQERLPGSFRAKRLLAISAFLLAGVALVVVLLDTQPGHNPLRSSHTEMPPPAPPAPDASGAVQVQTTRPIRRDVTQSITLPANVSPWYQATLYAKVSGYLKWMGADKGDTVKKGQLLAVIEAPEIEDQYQQAEADYSIKRITYARLRKVWEENPDVIAKQDVDVAQAAAQAAKHLRDSRRTLLDYTKVSAPFAGIITARFADPGSLIQSAAGTSTQAVPLFTLMDMDTVRIYASLPQEVASLIRRGTPVTLTAKELPEREFPGSITRTTNALDPATRTLLIEIDLPNKDHALKPGMYLNATIQLARQAGALAIPPAAVVTAGNDNGKHVFVIREGKAHKVAIQSGLDDGVWLEVTSGLTGDEEIVVVGKGSLTDGQAVQPSPYNLPSGKPSAQKF